MKPYRILKDFRGSQTGTDGPHFFRAGTTAELSDWLADVMVRAGFVKPGEDEKPSGQPTRETKVTGPEEIKPLDLADMPQKTLLAMAKDKFGLSFKGNPSKQTILAAISEKEGNA